MDIVTKKGTKETRDLYSVDDFVSCVEEYMRIRGELIKKADSDVCSGYKELKNSVLELKELEKRKNDLRKDIISLMGKRKEISPKIKLLKKIHQILTFSDITHKNKSVLKKDLELIEIYESGKIEERLKALDKIIKEKQK